MAVVGWARSAYYSDAGVWYTVWVPAWWLTSHLNEYTWPASTVEVGAPRLPTNIIRRQVFLKSDDGTRRRNLPVYHPVLLVTPSNCLFPDIGGTFTVWNWVGRRAEQVRAR